MWPASPTRISRVSLAALRGKLLDVDIADAARDAMNTPLSPDETYSVITRVSRRLSA